VFPCILSIYPNCIFNKKDPIVLGVKVEEGLCRMGTPLCIPDKNVIHLNLTVKKTLHFRYS
jgi:translation initiation factor 5B